MHRRGPLGILTVVLAGYIGGAAAGASLVRSWGAVLVVPIIVLVLLALTQPWWSPRAPVAPADGGVGLDEDRGTR